MSNNKILTPGSLKRSKDESRRQLDNNKHEIENNSKKINEQINNKLFGMYKNMALNIFTKIFSNNYGEYLDYDSLINSLTFKSKKNSLSPQFDIHFDENNVKFESDINKECRKFNENSYSNFISNDSMMVSDNMESYEFNNLEEYEAYEQGDILYSELSFLDGQFIPSTDDKDRFGEFNRINKLVGYTPKNISGETAMKEFTKQWNKEKNKILKNILSGNI